MKLLFVRWGSSTVSHIRRLARIRRTLLGIILVISVCLLAEWLPQRSAMQVMVAEEQGIPLTVICYDQLMTDPVGDALPLQLLEEDLRWLQQQGFETVLPAQLRRFVDGMGELPEKPVLLVMNGGYRTILTQVLPLLQEYGCRAVAAVAGSDADLYCGSVPRVEEEARLSWNENRMLEKSGLFEIASQSYSLHTPSGSDGRKGLARLRGESTARYHQLLLEDLLTMQTRMNEELSHDASVFCYPFGEKNTESQLVLEEMGFWMALSVGEGPVYLHENTDLLELSMTERTAEPSAEFFDQWIS